MFETAWRIELHSNFALAAARHQLMDGISGRLPVVQDGVNLLGNWHLNLARVRQANRRRGCEHSLGNHAVHVSDDFGQFSFPAEFNANSAVAGKTSRAGEDQITQARQARHGFGPSSAGHYQARHFGEATRDQRSYGIVSQTQAVADAGGDRHNIFQRAPQFHANHIVVGIDPEARIAEFPLHQVPELGVAGGNGYGRRIAPCNLQRKGRAAQSSNPWRPSTIGFEHVHDDLGHALQSAFFEPFGRAYNDGFPPQVWPHLLEDLAAVLRWHYANQDFCAIQRLRQSRSGRHRIGNAMARKKLLVHTPAGHGFADLPFMRPKTYPACSPASENDRESCPPCTRPDDRDLTHARLDLNLVSVPASSLRMFW